MSTGLVFDGDETPVEGCAWCGLAERGHGQRYTIRVGWHTWEAPDARLLRQRMWYRRTVRAVSRSLRVAS